MYDNTYINITHNINNKDVLKHELLIHTGSRTGYISTGCKLEEPIISNIL